MDSFGLGVMGCGEGGNGYLGLRGRGDRREVGWVWLGQRGFDSECFYVVVLG